MAGLATLISITLGADLTGSHMLLLGASAMGSAAIASAILGSIMIVVILLSHHLRINPDNVATPIAASLGDLVTLGLLSIIARGLFVISSEQLPLCVVLSSRSDSDLHVHMWIPHCTTFDLTHNVHHVFACSEKTSHSLTDPLVSGLDGAVDGSGAGLTNLTSNMTTVTAATTPQHPCELLSRVNLINLANNLTQGEGLLLTDCQWDSY